MAVSRLAFISKLLLIVINVGNIQHCSSYCPQECNCSTSVELHCVNSKLTSIPESEKSILHNVAILNMSFSHVDSLEEEIFSKRQFLMLEVIDLSYNDMSTINKNAFNGLEKVRALWLVKNKLNSLPENVFEPLKNLKELYLQENLLETIEKTTLRHLNSLTVLDLRNNKIASIQEDSFVHLKSLEKLLLAGNVMKKFESKMFNQLTSLCYLDVKFVLQSRGTNCKHLGGLTCVIIKEHEYSSECEVSCGPNSCEKKREFEDDRENLLTIINSIRKQSEGNNDLVWAVIITVGVLLMLVITLTMLIVVVRQSRDQIEDEESEMNDFEPFHGHVKPISEDELNLTVKNQEKKMCV